MTSSRWRQKTTWPWYGSTTERMDWRADISPFASHKECHPKGHQDPWWWLCDKSRVAWAVPRMEWVFLMQENNSEQEVTAGSNTESVILSLAREETMAVISPLLDSHRWYGWDGPVARHAWVYNYPPGLVSTHMTKAASLCFWLQWLMVASWNHLLCLKECDK